MHTNKTVALSLLGLLLATAASAQTKKDYYQSLEICRFEVPGDVGVSSEYVDALTVNLVSELGNAKTFTRVFREGTIEDAPAPGLRLIGQITQMKTGSQMKRYLIGFGAGKTVLKAHVQFVDKESGQVVYEKDADGKVIMGMYGGQSIGAARGLAKEIAKAAKMQF